MEERENNTHKRLKQMLTELEKEWSAMKTCKKNSSSPVSWITMVEDEEEEEEEEAIGFVENYTPSPRELMLSLQHHQACPEAEIVPIRSPFTRRKLFHDSNDDDDDDDMKATSFPQISNVTKLSDSKKKESSVVFSVTVTVLFLYFLVFVLMMKGFDHLSMIDTLVPT